MCSMKCIYSYSGIFADAGLVQCSGCIVLLAKIWRFSSWNRMSQIKMISLEITFQKLIALLYFVKTFWDYTFLKSQLQFTIHKIWTSDFSNFKWSFTCFLQCLINVLQCLSVLWPCILVVCLFMTCFFSCLSYITLTLITKLGFLILCFWVFISYNFCSCFYIFP